MELGLDVSILNELFSHEGEAFNVEVTLRNRIEKEHEYIDVHWRLLP